MNTRRRRRLNSVRKIDFRRRNHYVVSSRRVTKFQDLRYVPRGTSSVRKVRNDRTSLPMLVAKTTVRKPVKSFENSVYLNDKGNCYRRRSFKKVMMAKIAAQVKAKSGAGGLDKWRKLLKRERYDC